MRLSGRRCALNGSKRQSVRAKQISDAFCGRGTRHTIRDMQVGRSRLTCSSRMWRSLTAPQLVSLRTNHQDKLAQFRAALASATQALRDLPADDVTNSRARDVVGDYLDGELSKLNREWNAVRLFRYGSLAAATLTAGSTAMALGVQGPAPATQLLPLLTGSLSVASAAAALGLDETRLQANNLYVLWEAARKGKRHRAIGARGHGG